MAKLQLAIEGAEDLGATDAQLRGARQLLQRRQKRSTTSSGGSGSGQRHSGSGRHAGRQSKSPGSSTHGGSAGPFGGSPRPGSAPFRLGTPRRANSPASPVAMEQVAAPLSGLHSPPSPEEASAWRTVEGHGKHGGLVALSSGLAPVKIPSPESLSADSTPSSSVRLGSATASTDGGETPGSPPTVVRERSPHQDGRISTASEHSPSGARSPPEYRPSPLQRSPPDRCQASPDPPPQLQPVPAVASPATPPARLAARSPAKAAPRIQDVPPRTEKALGARAAYSPAGSSSAEASPPDPVAAQPPRWTPPLRPSSGSMPYERARRHFDDMVSSPSPVPSPSVDGDEGLRATDAVVPGPAYSRPRSSAATMPLAPPTHSQHAAGSSFAATPATTSRASSASGWIAALSAFGADLSMGGAPSHAPPSPAHGPRQEPPLWQQPPPINERRSSWRRSVSLSAFRTSPSLPLPPTLQPQLLLPTPRSLSQSVGGSAADPRFVRPTSPLPSESVSPSMASQLSPNAKEFRPEPRRPSRLSASHRCGQQRHVQHATPVQHLFIQAC